MVKWPLRVAVQECATPPAEIVLCLLQRKLNLREWNTKRQRELKWPSI
jgi:hypothetical protein